MKLRSTALIASVSLHAGIVGALLFVHFDRDAGIGQDRRIVTVSLVSGTQATASDGITEFPDDAAGTTTAPDVTDQITLTEADSQAVAAEELAIIEPTSAPEPVLAEQTVQPPVQSIQDLEPQTTPVFQRFAPAIETLLEPFTTEIPDRERTDIEREVERFSREFVALGQWQQARDWTHQGESYSATVTHIPPTSDTGIDEALVTVTTSRAGRKMTTEMRMQRLGFSHYAQFIDRWDPSVQIHDDIIEGRFHSNSEIYISNDNGVQPTFLDKVTTAYDVNTSYSDRRVRRDDVFIGGLETRVRRIVLPRPDSLFTGSAALPEQQVRRVSVSSRIRFDHDSYSIQSLDMTQPAIRQSLSKESHYLIAEKDATIYISGIVDARVLIYSPEDIVIEGNLTYPEHPEAAPQLSAYLGLVSNKSIEIGPPEVTGPGDLHIHAAIYARNRFAVRRYTANEKATLFVHGSITAGTLTPTEPRFRTRLSFDRRFKTIRPPRFPMTDQYELLENDSVWTFDSDG